jgi:AcrR family transcriptional regulator
MTRWYGDLVSLSIYSEELLVSEHSLTYSSAVVKTLPKPTRAPALAPEARRAALVDAAVPLVLERGFDVTTKDLAAAAGVAEGTIFRVFESKDDLVLAAARSVFARTDHLDELEAISPRLAAGGSSGGGRPDLADGRPTNGVGVRRLPRGR